MYMGWSAGLLHAHVPFNQAADLALGVAARRHALHEVVVLLFGLAVLLGAERNHRQQILDLREHALLDYLADLLVAGPGRVLAAVVGPGAQREFHDLVAEVLRIGDARRLLDLGQLLVEQIAVEQLAGVRILEVRVLDPGIGVIDVAVEQVLPIVGIGFEVRFLDLMADELGIARRELGLDELQIALLDLVGELLAADRLLQHVHEVDRIGGDLGGIVVEGRSQNLEREPGRDAVHALVNAGGVAVFLHAARLRVGLLEAFAVVDPHLGVHRRVLVLAQPRQHAEARQHLERRRRAQRVAELGALDQLLVDLLFLGHAQNVRHLDDADAVDESLVVLVALEALPFGLVRVREHDAGEGNGADVFGADVVAFLGRRQQRMQHLDRRLEHLYEFKDALIGAVEAARVAVGVGIVLRQRLELADVDLAHQRGDVLVVLVARLGLGDRDLPQARGRDLGDAEAGDIAAEGFEPLEGPRAHQSGQTPPRDAVALLDDRAHRLRVEQAKRILEHRAELVVRLEDIDRVHLHERLEPLGQRRLAAADRAEQVENLLALLEPLRRVAEEGDDPLDRLLHAVESRERRIDPDRAVQKNSAKARVLGRVDHLRLADRGQYALRSVGVAHRVGSTRLQVFPDRHVRFTSRLEGAGEGVEQRIVVHDPSMVRYRVAPDCDRRGPTPDTRPRIIADLITHWIPADPITAIRRNRGINWIMNTQLPIICARQPSMVPHFRAAPARSAGR